MDKNYLFESEEIVSQSEGEGITLTNFRLRYVNFQSGKAHMKSILLENLGSVEIEYKSKPLFILLATITGLAALFFLLDGESELLIITSFLTVVFISFYFVSRKHMVVILSKGGGKIDFHSKGLNSKNLMGFINSLEREAIKRNNQLTRFLKICC